LVFERSVYEWIEKLENGSTNVRNEEGTGHLATARNEDKIELAHDTWFC
jgi:hypothetical protein